MKFVDFNLPEFIIKALAAKSIGECMPVQEKTIPRLMDGMDVIGKSRTGSGKTFAYGIPAVCGIDTDSGDTQVLVVCPTRELAAQVTEQMRFLNSMREGCKVIPLFGGINMARQVASLKKNAEIVVGTPGRIIDHLKRKTLKIANLKTLVLDEADEMLSMGFKDEIEYIMSKCPATRQTALFSATMPEGVVALAKTFMRDPVIVDTGEIVTHSVAQYYVKTGLKEKDAVLKSLIKRLKPVHSIIFCNTKRMVDKLSSSLASVDVRAAAIHGDMRQQDRKEAIRRLKDGEVDMLVATDVAARGLDIEGVDIVFNYDVPQTPEYYTHRIGRTGRVDKKGLAFTLINTDWGMKSLLTITDQTHNRVEEYCLSDSRGSAGERRKKADRSAEKAEREAHKTPEYIKKGEKLKALREYIDENNFSRKTPNKSGYKKPAQKSSYAGRKNNDRRVGRDRAAQKGNNKSKRR